MLSLPRPPDRSRVWSSTAAARCPRPPSTPRRWRFTSRRSSTRSTVSWRRAATRPGQLAKLGVPADRLEVLSHYLPAEAFAERSRAHQGAYALVAATALGGEGRGRGGRGRRGRGRAAEGGGRRPPRRASSRGWCGVSTRPVELLGRVERDEMAGAACGRRGADRALALAMSSAPFAALEAMAAGVPVVATRMGGLPELIGPERCVAPDDPDALAERLRELWDDPRAPRRRGRAAARPGARAPLARSATCATCSGSMSGSVALSAEPPAPSSSASATVCRAGSAAPSPVAARRRSAEPRTSGTSWARTRVGVDLVADRHARRRAHQLDQLAHAHARPARHVVRSAARARRRPRRRERRRGRR